MSNYLDVSFMFEKKGGGLYMSMLLRRHYAPKKEMNEKVEPSEMTKPTKKPRKPRKRKTKKVE